MHFLETEISLYLTAFLFVVPCNYGFYVSNETLQIHIHQGIVDPSTGKDGFNNRLPPSLEDTLG